MNMKAILTWLTLAVMIAVSACGAPAPATEPPVATEPPATEPPAATEAPTEAPATEPPTAVESPTLESGGEFFFVEGPYVPSEEKPGLAFSEAVKLPAFPDPVEVVNVVQQSVAFTLPDNAPDWTIIMKVAPFIDIIPSPLGELTPVGVVEIGELGQVEPGIYEVRIDLGSGEPVVSGQLSPITATTTYDVGFARIPQILNPDRIDSPYKEFQNPPLDNTVAISADSVCFVVKTDGDPSYIRYCSEAGSALSVRTNFASQYENLLASIFDVAVRFGLQDFVQLDQIISTMEHPGRIQACSQLAKAAPQAQQSVCGSDITVAPVTLDYFNEKYEEAKSQSTDGRFSVPVAAVQILRPIEVSKGVLLPGDYHMDYWFDENEKFYAATISGFTTEEREVTNQQVPAVPATFINVDGTEQPGAQISACRIFGRCTFFQKSCS